MCVCVRNWHHLIVGELVGQMRAHVLEGICRQWRRRNSLRRNVPSVEPNVHFGQAFTGNVGEKMT